MYIITKMKEEKLMPAEVEKAIEGLREEGRLEGALKTYVNLLQEGLISEEVVLSKLNISKEELNEKMKELAIIPSLFSVTALELYYIR